MKHTDDFASKLPTQPADIDELSDLMQKLRLLKERITTLEAECHGVFDRLQNWGFTAPVGHEQTAHITIQRQQAGTIAIAINTTPQSPPSTPRSTQRTISRSPTTEIPHPSHASFYISGSPPAAAPFVTSSSHQPAMFGNPALPSTPFPFSSSQPPAPPPTPISFVPSQPIGPLLSWGRMMTPREVQELLALQPQTGEYYVVTKGRRPGVYLSWPEAHELIDGLKSPCYWKRTDRYVAQGQYTVAYNKGNCEYRFE